MSAHPITYRYLEVIAQNANQTVESLRPDDTWVALGISDDDTMRRIAIQLQMVAAAYNPKARITLGQVVGAKDVAGGLILTWKAASLGTLTREQAGAEIVRAQTEPEDAAGGQVAEVVVTAAKRKKSTKKKRKKKVAKRKSRPKTSKRAARRGQPARKK